VLIIVLVSYDPPVILFTVFLLYALSGPIWTLMLLRQRRGERRAQRRADVQSEEKENSSDDFEK